MQIIVMHARFTQAKSVTLSSHHLLLAVLAFLVLMVVSGALMAALTLRLASADVPGVRMLLPQASMLSGDANQKDRYLKENLAAMAVKLGEMQAQLMRLDALGERVQGLAGVKPEEFNFKELPPRGGPEMSSDTSHALNMSEFQAALDALQKDVESRSDYMNVVETNLMGFKIQSKLLPTVQPVNVTYNASGFGWRLDPFTGRSAFHEGIDFPAPTGTAIVAAAGGVVVAAEFHPQFGNMLEIDHGGDLITRYAHTSKIYVKLGDIVKRGQHVADIGSTGRSTGSHLHFEVRIKDVPQNPNKFLSAGANQAKLYALSQK
ncbi:MULTISPECIES: M23 family metallopeptidase [unclassified Undibacterium]|uniref:M23 family metallopeptidase n=1 Tax=unclassified Undibacterium TaxID=2630295 RepID=UPI002AC9A8DA|nr:MULTISPECIES: M23 family metallopeptidase [unclassified Undibacterium]MEB0138230.1 M23 family metallopeptidase [Undibacterium sp. CCC2.1]MEB0171609.1 M23 family metallopeptidase [Undibacterium sp. CCC1.1]MEB0175471.1 M23 family metallopeptidase [Undibacterium sp. CCC3.4]MEB0214809.1 M23 family metallopeptidase [Undibacterium sp. 5I2]WPX45295.1 M23 family metallopeptidase [Undibacterium sp. CCC3.4]